MLYSLFYKLFSSFFYLIFYFSFMLPGQRGGVMLFREVGRFVYVICYDSDYDIDSLAAVSMFMKRRLAGIVLCDLFKAWGSDVGWKDDSDV